MDEKLYKNLSLNIGNFPALNALEKITSFTSSFDNVLSPIKNLNNQMEPLFRLIGKINAVSNNLSNLYKGWDYYEKISKIYSNISIIANPSNLINPFPELTKFSKYVSLVNKCQSSDWIPHRTTPFELFSSCLLYTSRCV